MSSSMTQCRAYPLVNLRCFGPKELLRREIRRASLVNLMPTPSSLPAILSRMRDVDATLRKIVYHHVLAELPSPLVLTIAQREQICQIGLGDRDPTVRAAAGKVIGGWVECVGGLEGVRITRLVTMLQRYRLNVCILVSQDA